MSEPSAIGEILGVLAFFAATATLLGVSEFLKKFIRAGRARVARYEARVSKTGKVE